MKPHSMIQFTAALMLGCFSLCVNAQAPACNKTVYMTFDTGNMSVAQKVAEILQRQNIKASFFLANEKTFRGDYALEDSWKPY